VIFICGTIARGSVSVDVGGTDRMYDFEMSYNRLIINGNVVTSSNTPGTSNERELVLWTNNSHYSFASGRYYSFQVTKNGSVVLDLIPVRVGQVGYMYDRIGRRLLGNAGSGTLVVGHDLQ
jgi:hypothetical protein